MQPLVNGAHVKKDQVAIIADEKLRRKPDRLVSPVAAIHAGQYPETVSPLGPQVLQGFADRHLLPVGKLGALEEVSHRSSGQ